MREAAFQELLIMKENNVLKAFVLSRYPRSSYYYRSKQPIISRRNRRSDSALLEAVEEVVPEYPSCGVRRITVMLHKGGIATVNRKKVYRLMNLAC